MGKIFKAHKIRLYPTQVQSVLLNKSCGVARFSYNWALAKWQELYAAGEKTSAYGLVKLQNSLKRSHWPFFMEVSKTAPQYAIHNLEKAFKKFFRGEARCPKFKKKSGEKSFVAIENKEAFWQKDYRISIPRVGRVKCAENLRFEGKVNKVVVKCIANKWFAIISVEVLESIPALKRNESGDNQAIVGIDLGIKTMMVLSDGSFYANPKALHRNMRRLKRMQRSLCRKVKGSNNRKRNAVRLASLHLKIANIRMDSIQKATTAIVAKYDCIVLEDLNVIGMLKNRSLSGAISDVAFSEIRRQITYKSEANGVGLIIADRFFASSKTCSFCGYKKQSLNLSERNYTCESCGQSIDRDLNAAKNLAEYGTTLGLSGSQVCGEGSSVAEMQHSLSVKQNVQQCTSQTNQQKP